MYFRSIFVACMACASEVLIWENTLALASKSTQALYKCKFYNMWTAWSYLQLQIKFKYQIVLKVKHISWSVESNQIHFLLVLEWLNARASVLYNKSILQSHYISLWVCVCACVCVCVCVCVCLRILEREREGMREGERQEFLLSRLRLSSFSHILEFTYRLTWKSVSKQTIKQKKKRESLKELVLLSLFLFFSSFWFYQLTKRLGKWWFRHNSHLW